MAVFKSRLFLAVLSFINLSWSTPVSSIDPVYIFPSPAVAYDNSGESILSSNTATYGSNYNNQESSVSREKTDKHRNDGFATVREGSSVNTQYTDADKCYNNENNAYSGSSVSSDSYGVDKLNSHSLSDECTHAVSQGKDVNSEMSKNRFEYDSAWHRVEEQRIYSFCDDGYVKQRGGGITQSQSTDIDYDYSKSRDYDTDQVTSNCEEYAQYDEGYYTGAYNQNSGVQSRATGETSAAGYTDSESGYSAADEHTWSKDSSVESELGSVAAVTAADNRYDNYRNAGRNGNPIIVN